MGSGIELARAEAPEHAAVMDNFRDQLLIVLIRRLGGKISIPVAECDDTGGHVLKMNVIDRIFNFALEKKQ